ncbi:MAG: AAA-like domain-containing protein [Scytonema sp. PMC 1069.18]|nr:AAA-like domain-containing protein [Scytonema sp. PMC 1069.18]MEC4887563.1 AAA-like domain-containing protein [Scytonema sp. PMC 1070.18]
MRYQVGGSLRSNDPTYVVREADGILYNALKEGDFCYVFNSRQMGKSSLLQRISYRLEQQGCACVYIDVSRLGSDETTTLQWYKGTIISLFQSLNLGQHINFKDWWQQQTDLSPVQRLHQFVEEVLLRYVQHQRIFIFIDEIDSLLSLNFPVNDFFVWIRHCYNQRSHNAKFDRLGFALFGVASPRDLISDKRRTPFNIGTAIELYGFQLHEVTPLLKGLEQVVNQSEAVLREMIFWTQGQPFLTQKLCQLVSQIALKSSTGIIALPAGTEKFWVEELVRSRIIQHWEAQDEPEHLRTIRDRLLSDEQKAGRLLGLYQRILQAEEVEISTLQKRKCQEVANGNDKLSPASYLLVPTDDSQEQTELLLSGLVEKRNGYLRVKNPIYRNVFNADWVLRQLDNLRPYSQTFNAWIKSSYQDKSRLLRGQALKDAQKWALSKSLSDLDYQFLAASQEYEAQEVQMALEAARAKAVEAQLEQQNKAAKLQRFLLIAVCIGLMISSGLGIGTFILYRQAVSSERQARSSEIQALTSSAEGLFASNHRLDALVEAIKARKKLQKLGMANTNIKQRVEDILRQAVYSSDEYNRLSGHTAAVMAVDVSPDNSLIASASIDKTARIWGVDGKEVATLKGHKAAVRTVDFSFDSQMLATAGDDSTIKLWKRDSTDASWHIATTLQGHTGGVWGVKFSPDGQFIASASFDKTVKIWKLDGKLLKTFQHGTMGFTGVSFSPDGRAIAAGSTDQTVKIWKRNDRDWQTAKLFQTLEGHKGWVTGLAFSPDGQSIASSSDDRTVKLWQQRGTNGRYRLSKTFQGHSAGVWGVAFSPDGQKIASASLDKTIKVWNIDGTERKTYKGHSASVWGVNFSPDGSFIASAGGENVVRLWQNENPFQTTITAHNAGIWSIAISSDSSTIATASHENTAKFWSRQGRLLKTLTEDETTIFQVSFANDNQLIASAANNETVKLWKPDGSLVKTYKAPNSQLLAAVLSPDGQTIAMANVDKLVQIWSRNRPVPIDIRGHQADVWDVVFSPDSQIVASVSADNTVKLWTLDGRLLNTLKGHTASVWRVAFSPDSKMVASGSGDNTVKLWTLDGKLLRTLKGHTAAVWGVAFSPDGQIVASASVDADVKLWKLDGTEITTLRGHTAALRRLAISRDGTLLASGGDDNILILWNLQKVLKLDVLGYSCKFVQDYLKTNVSLEEGDRHLCDSTH